MNRNVLIGLVIALIIFIAIGAYLYMSTGTSSGTGSTTPAVTVPVDRSVTRVIGSCDGERVAISCPYPDQKIKVNKAFYGRRNTTACPGPGAATAENRSLATATDEMAALLNGQNSGNVYVAGPIFGGSFSADPYPNVFKEFELDYTCS